MFAMRDDLREADFSQWLPDETRTGGVCLWQRRERF